MSPIRPLADRVLVQPLEAPETSAGGVVLPDVAREDEQRAVVVAVGPGRILDSGTRLEPEVKDGDVVIYAKYGGMQVKDGKGKPLILLRESDLLAVDDDAIPF